MGVLAEYLQSEAERIRLERQQRTEAIREWRESVQRLLATLSVWLQEADGGLGLIASRLGETTVKEPRLGQYQCPKLSILTGDPDRGEFSVEAASVVPRARFVLAEPRPAGREPRTADGIVDIREGGGATFYLFRWKAPAGDEWFICSDGEWNNIWSKDRYRVQPLTSEAFETAVLGAVR